MILDTTHAIGWKANDFALQGIDGKTYSLAEVCGPKGTLAVFICNHCPYVKASTHIICWAIWRYRCEFALLSNGS